jgi:hypothetical protein
MPTRVVIDDRLIQKAQALGGHKSKAAAVTAALREYVQRRKQAEIIQLFGMIEFDPGWDYKANRRRRTIITTNP